MDAVKNYKSSLENVLFVCTQWLEVKMLFMWHYFARYALSLSTENWLRIDYWLWVVHILFIILRFGHIDSLWKWVDLIPISIPEVHIDFCRVWRLFLYLDYIIDSYNVCHIYSSTQELFIVFIPALDVHIMT